MQAFRSCWFVQRAKPLKERWQQAKKLEGQNLILELSVVRRVLTVLRCSGVLRFPRANLATMPDSATQKTFTLELLRLGQRNVQSGR